MRRIAVVDLKGGSAKTTTSITVAVANDLLERNLPRLRIEREG